MKKSLFNFYLDDEDKEKAVAKLLRLRGEESKGQLAALLRVLIKQFNATPDEKINPLLIEAVGAEFTYSKTLNKRSRL
jgi:hypothetical protein